MTAKDFQQYLEHPRMLYDLPLASLQQLAMEYPYSPNLRLLLLLKSHLEGHDNEADYLNRCAAAAFDRSFIYDLLRDADPLPPAQDTDVLELRTLEELALEEAALTPAPPPETKASTLTYANIFPEYDNKVVDAETPEIETPAAAETTNAIIVPTAPEVPEPETTPAAEEFPAIDMNTWAGNATAFQVATPDWTEAKAPTIAEETTAEQVTDEPAAPEPLSKFEPSPAAATSGMLRDRLRQIRRRQTDKLAHEQEEVKKIARRSLVSQEAVASETLARLLVRQGQYQNAIKMYRRLELLYPEKKAIFAGLIKDLKEKL